MRTLILFGIFLVILIFACLHSGTGVVLSSTGMVMFILIGASTLFLGMSQSDLRASCFGIALVSLGIGCYFLLEYFGGV